LAQAVNPNGNHSIDSILDGTFLESTDEPIPLTETENTWVQALQSLVYSPIKLLLSPEDFKQFFKRKQESTSSSPSGRHMGHYKVMLDELQLGRPLLAEIITAIAQISFITSSPLPR
jgi:hypothetical protein